MSASTNGQVEQTPMSDQEIEQKRLLELDQAEVSPDVNAMLLYNTLSHCAEPADAQTILTKLEAQADVTPKADAAPSSSADKEKDAAAQEHADGSYRVKFDGRSFPQRHPTWPEAFRLHVDEQQEYFYVLKSEGDEPSTDEDVYETGFAPGDPKTRVGEFGYRYACGSKARDENGNLVGKENGQIEFSYAEHKQIGEMLQLRWSATKTTPGTTELNLPNEVKLTYGEINGLGGDFFGGYNPVSNGKNLDEQCKYFMEAFDTLANNGAKLQVELLLEGRKPEVEAIAKAVKNGESTFEAYKALSANAEKIGGQSKEDVETQLITAFGTGPSYMRLLQVNFDHFGKDAVKAYNAGHYCALKTAAAGKLELGYAMNAFADHYLGDCFASGHFRTPRRALHGSSTVFGAAWDAISGMLQTGIAGDGITAGAMKVMAPDLLSMLMHNEDNTLGITVVNRKGQEFSIWGDHMLNEPQNVTNKEMMRQALQASADEVYEAYESKKAKEPTEGSGYRPWSYAPATVVDSKTHSPLFKEYELPLKEKIKLYWPLQVREPFWDTTSKKYIPIGNSANLIKRMNEIKDSEQWKKY